MALASVAYDNNDFKSEKPAAPIEVGGVSKQKAIFGILAAVVCGILVYFLLAGFVVSSGEAPGPHTLSPQGRSLAAVFVVALILWATEAIPIAITSLFMVVLPPLLSVVPSIKAAAVGFTTPVVFFVIGTYCLAFSLVECGIGRRFALWLFSHAGTTTKGALLALMIASAVLSALVSDVPAAAIGMALAIPFLDKLNVRPGASNLGKAMMIGIPIAALTGGVATPAGSSINMLGLNLLKASAGIEVGFLHWMALGIPMVIILIPFEWWAILKCYPPEIESVGDLNEFKEELHSMGKLKTTEKKVLTIMIILFVLWVASTWIKQIDVATVSILGAVAMFLPGINILGWRQIEAAIGWETVLMIGSVTSLGIAASKTGLAGWMVTGTLGGITGWNMILLVALISAFVVVFHLPLPIAPAINAVLIPAMVVLANQAGINPALFALPVAFTASCAFLLPLDAVCLVTYSKGYYRMLDMALPGVLISIAWVIVMTAVMFIIAPMLGFG